MKRVWGPILLLAMFAVTVWGAGPGEEYVRIYSLIQQGETLQSSNHPAEALAAFLDAQKDLARLQKSYPGWNANVVDFRLRYLETKVNQLQSAAVEPAASLPSSGVGAETAAPDTSVEMASEMNEMQRELQQLQMENNSLQQKLREALSVRPAAADPRQLEKMERRNLELTKEIELLKSELKEAPGRSAPAADVEALQAAQAALAQETRRADQLEVERSALASEVAQLKASTAMTKTLREENALLKTQLSQLQNQARAGTDTDTQRRLDEVVTELALVRSEAVILRLEKTALEDRMKQLRNRPAESGQAVTAELNAARARVGDLERERNQLQLQLAQANQEIAARAAATVGEPSGADQAEITRLKARLQVYEAERTPYSVEELALLRMSKALSASAASRPQPPSGTGPLVAQAERQFKEGQFQQAENTLKEVLARDDNNAFTLSNLAATQMEQGRDAEAEANLRKALAVAPRDPFTLATLGILMFRQKQYEEALDYLGLAAQYNPDNPVVQNYLGMTLSEQGMRGPAETALRRAVQLQPGFGDAHFNLALVYILQDPPLRELARWHYQKALAAGHARSPEMEQLLEKRGIN